MRVNGGTSEANAGSDDPSSATLAGVAVVGISINNDSPDVGNSLKAREGTFSTTEDTTEAICGGEGRSIRE